MVPFQSPGCYIASPSIFFKLPMPARSGCWEEAQQPHCGQHKGLVLLIKQFRTKKHTDKRGLKTFNVCKRVMHTTPFPEPCFGIEAQAEPFFDRCRQNGIGLVQEDNSGIKLIISYGRQFFLFCYSFYFLDSWILGCEVIKDGEDLNWLYIGYLCPAFFYKKSSELHTWGLSSFIFSGTVWGKSGHTANDHAHDCKGIWIQLFPCSSQQTSIFYITHLAFLFKHNGSYSKWPAGEAAKPVLTATGLGRK